MENKHLPTILRFCYMNWSYSKIGRYLGISKQRVGQIIKRFLEKGGRLPTVRFDKVDFEYIRKEAIRLGTNENIILANILRRQRGEHEKEITQEF